MLIQSMGKCEICGSADISFLMQEASVICKNCKNQFTVCDKCKAQGCPVCDGRLESQMEWATKNKVMF
ncbi:MAG: hypothetical protein DRQ51_08805 [Gammaproteobacteria bacterium]|nr:MAG: hypothetical protein DRQ51_08805 [Gammaproteobacteria bacterium]